MSKLDPHVESGSKKFCVSLQSNIFFSLFFFVSFSGEPRRAMNVTTIINQNNKTLAFLQDEEYHSAIASSMSALASLSRDYKILSKDQAQPQSRSDPRSLDQCMLLNESLKEDPDISTPTFIYTCGIPLPPTITDLEIVTPIVVFNCALAQHLAAEERGASTKTRPCNEQRNSTS